MNEENRQDWAQERLGTWGIPAWTPTLGARQSGRVQVSEGGLPGSERRSSVGEIASATDAYEKELAAKREDDLERARALEMMREPVRRW
jgi:hypothetical protein